MRTSAHSIDCPDLDSVSALALRMQYVWIESAVDRSGAHANLNAGRLKESMRAALSRRDKESNTMRFQSLIAFAATLAMGVASNAQFAATHVDKAAKDTSHDPPRVIQGTAPGATQTVEKTSSAAGQVIKKTGRGVKRWAKRGPWSYGEYTKSADAPNQGSRPS